MKFASQTTYSAVLGVALSAIRMQKHKGQAYMAEQMGLSQASYSRLESGKSTFTVDQMYQAADALGISEWELSDRLNGMIVSLRNQGTNVVAQSKSVTGEGDGREPALGGFVIGASLTALLIALASSSEKGK